MARKLGVFGPRTEVLDALQASEGNGNGHNGNGHDERNGHGPTLPEQTLMQGSSDWTPEQTEQYIDWRLQNIDLEIAGLRSKLEELTALRKRWLAVTGGRSKVGGVNGSNGGSGA
ncbi:MAG TPA: hypothetical protein VLV45_12280 [Gemmatimonadales bacterium]|nr:hypothetical protein [Gemmatimonadales bacterium]